MNAHSHIFGTFLFSAATSTHSCNSPLMNCQASHSWKSFKMLHHMLMRDKHPYHDLCTDWAMFKALSIFDNFIPFRISVTPRHVPRSCRMANELRICHCFVDVVFLFAHSHCLCQNVAACYRLEPQRSCDTACLVELEHKVQLIPSSISKYTINLIRMSFTVSLRISLSRPPVNVLYT